jgi:sugar O-acyltransferase (sialic acid O-acetyltransferase NeuD family)
MEIGKVINGIKVVGALTDIYRFHNEHTYVICAIGSSKIRQDIISIITQENVGLKFAVLVHPTAIIPDEISIQEGSSIFALSMVSTNVNIGRHVVISYGVTIGHDSYIKDYGTILPGCHLAGNVIVHRGAEIGTGASVIQGMEIGEYSIVGAGAVVIRPIPDCCTAVGVPAKPIKFRSSS